MDPVTCTYVNTATLVVAFIPIWRYIVKQDSLGILLCCCSFVAAVLMHISDTKHGLPGVHFKKYSRRLLSIDRFVTCVLAGYGVFNYVLNYLVDPDMTSLMVSVTTFGIGFIALEFSDRTNNLTLFTILRTIWHVCAYGTLAYII